VRMRTTCSRPNSAVNASVMMSGDQGDIGILGPLAVNTLAGWCSVFHQ